MGLWSRIRHLHPSVRAARERELEREIQSHLDAEAAESGLREARVTFGNVQLVKEDVRAEVGWTHVEQLWRDLRLGARQLRRHPAFALVAIATFALGIGANAAIFSIVNGVLLRPLAYAHAEQLMYLDAPGTGASLLELSVPEYLEFQQFNTSFSEVGAFRTDDTNLTVGDRAVRVRAAVADASLLQALGVAPFAGRLFAREETDGPRQAPVVIISYSLWQSLFGGQFALGQRVDLDGRPAEVVGVLPAGADVMDVHAEIWLPLSFLPDELKARGNHNLRVIGRLKPGVTKNAAQAELRTLVQTWAARANLTSGGSGHAGHVFGSSADGKGHFLRMTPLADQVLGRASQSIWVLQAAVALVLLIACANVANLLLARSEGRRREFAVLTALGAGRGAVLRKALTESVIIALAGCALGVVIARAGIRVRRSMPTPTGCLGSRTSPWTREFWSPPSSLR